MQSMVVCSLNHDTTTSLRLSHAPIFLKIHPHLYGHNSVRMHPYAHPQHLKVLKHFISNIDVGCSLWGFTSTIILQHHTGSAIPQFS